jgi:hypothetical protein
MTRLRVNGTELAFDEAGGGERAALEEFLGRIAVA